jgi:hypothetical protein
VLTEPAIKFLPDLPGPRFCGIFSGKFMILLISLLLALLPLLGVAWIILFGSIATVDGIFTSLILLSMSAAFGFNLLLELRKPRSATGGKQGARVNAVTAAGSERLQRGRVEKVEFFEANVGQPNKSIVTFSSADATPQMLVFEGDLRNALPVGHKVEISFRKAAGYNVLTSVASA